jgi:GAF domain-containing protein
MTREELLARTFVEMADTWGVGIDEHQVSRLVTTRCVELFDASAAGILLSDANGQITVAASSNSRMHTTELYEIQVGEGPCLECYLTGQPVVDGNLRRGRRWQRFTPVALHAGYPSVLALPIHARGQVIGALNLFRSDIGTLGGADTAAAQALADACAITILRQRGLAKTARGLSETAGGRRGKHRRRPGGWKQPGSSRRPPARSPSTRTTTTSLSRRKGH